MLVTHLAFDREKWLLWGETAPQTKTRRKTTKYVYAADVLEVKSVFPALQDNKAVKVTALVPTTEGQPLASGPLVADWPAPVGLCTLEKWKLEALLLDSDQVVDILVQCKEKRVLSPGVVVGDDLAHWIRVLEFSQQLVSQGSFLPSVFKESKNFVARWQPVVRGEDHLRMMRLKSAMPAACVCLSTDKDFQKLQTAGLTTALDLMVDHLVRGAAAQLPRMEQHSVHDRWLSALVSPDSAIKGTAAELERLVEDIAAWKYRFTYLSSMPLRLIMRIDEHQEEEGQWILDFLVMDLADPSRHYTVEEAWMQADSRWREFLILAVAQAMDICPPLQQCLESAAPRPLMLSTEDLYAFLTTYVPLLMNTGFTLQLPRWWTKEGNTGRVSLRARARSPRTKTASKLNLSSILTVDFEAALGDEVLTAEDLQALAEAKVPIVRLRGQWVHVQESQLTELMRVLKGRSRKLTLTELLRMAAGGEYDNGLAVERVVAEGELQVVLDVLLGRASGVDTAPLPQNLTAELRPYQETGYKWMEFLSRYGLGACLADDMGLGKTLQALTLLQNNYEQGEERPTLLVCPTSLLINWRKEAARFTPELKVYIHHGPSRALIKKEFDTRTAGAQVIITSYSLAQRDQELLSQTHWAGIVIDEAQNIKNAETRQSRAIRGFNAQYKLALTGTPVENNVGELWSLFDFLNPGLLGTQADFRRRFFLPIETWGNQSAREKLRSLTKPFILRRMKSDRTIIADLPDKIEEKLYCGLSAEQASLYAAVVKEVEESIDQVEGMQRRGLVLSTLTRLKQLCNHPALLLKDGLPDAKRSGKLTRLTELVDSILSNNEKVLVFTQYVEMGEILTKHLRESFAQEVLWLHGAVNKEARDVMVEKFQSAGPPQIFVLSLKAGGTGLNLTQATQVIHFDRWWNPAVEDQATDRAYRIGQTSTVQVHKFICAGTLEDKIDELIERKRKLAGELVTAGETWLTELSTQELKALWSLEREALEDNQ